MIVVGYKSMINAHGYSDERKKAETFRLITVIYSDIKGSIAICERLYDEFVGKNDKAEKFKGDLFSVEIDRIRVISTTNEEDERERLFHLKELRTLLDKQ